MKLHHGQMAGSALTYAEGRLCRKTDRNGVEILYTYNMYGNPLLRKAGDLSERYEYTPEGLLKSAISQGMRYGYAYDVMGRLKEKTASGRTLLSLEYDRNGNLSRQTDLTGKVTEYRYDLMDQMESVWDDGTCVAKYEYNLDGTVRRLTNGDSLYTEYSYDLDKNLTGLKTMLGEEVLADNHYRHDGNGNTLEKRQLGSLTSYAYDQMNRLSLVQYPDRKEELFYDKAGNRSRRICGGMEERYEYDRRNRLITYKKGGDTSHFEYDHAGNLSKDNHAKYEYDSFNRTAKVETFDGNIQVNRYDPEGLRHEMEENGKLVSFIFRDREVIAEETTGDTVRYIRGTELLSSDAIKARTYYHYASDEMGSVTHVTDKSQVLNRYEYDVWGNVTASEERVENRFKFNGQQYDPISQQYYLRARYYNPVIGRFTQEDTYRGDGLNLYVYCANNPVCFVDPSGYCGENQSKNVKDKTNERSAKEQGAKNLDKHLSDKKNGGKLSPQEEKLSGEHGGNGKGENNNGYFTDKYGRWHRPNGQYASNEEVGLPAPGSRKGKGDSEAQSKEENNRYTPDQQAVIELAKEAKKKGGITASDAEILKGWANEYDVPNHGPEKHPDRPGAASNILHIHIGKTGHIPVIDD